MPVKKKTYLLSEVNNLIIKNNYINNIPSIFINAGEVLTSFSIPGNSPFGITVDSNGNLISVDNGTDKIYVHDGISSTTTNNFSAPDNKPEGLTIDPNTGNLISADQSTNPSKIYVHQGISSTVTSSFSAPGNFPRGLNIDNNGNLISCDAGTDKIYIHDGISSQITSSFDSPGNFPKGLTIDPNTGNLIVVAYDGEYKFYIVKL